MLIEHFNYSLRVEDGRIGVITDGCEVMTLDVRSGVHTLADGARVTDSEPDIPTLVTEEKVGETYTFLWKNKSSLWEEKTYRLVCDPLRFIFTVSVKGKGCVDEVEYFTGDASVKIHGSDYEFDSIFDASNPFIRWESHSFSSSVDDHRRDAVFMVPPMFLYSFTTAGLSKRFALGVAAKGGEHNFSRFDYMMRRVFKSHTTFSLSTDQSGHVTVDGEWESPMIVGFSAENDIEACEIYSKYYFTSGLAERKPVKAVPDFHKGPIACGWLEQFFNFDGDIFAASNEDFYEEFLRELHARELYPRLLILDAKWQEKYGTCTADPAKWRDMRAFIDRRRAEGVHTMLWFMGFETEGLSEDYITEDREGRKYIDVSHPGYLAELDGMLYHMLSSDEGCINADGLKIDFMHRTPVKTYSGKYGVEYKYEFLKHVYETAKRIKPDCIINHSACHPYFAHICDHARVHDYHAENRHNLEEFELRCKLFRIAMPDTLIDTDNAGFNTRRDTMRWLLRQPYVGIPALYAVRTSDYCRLTDSDYAAIAMAWREYDAMK